MEGSTIMWYIGINFVYTVKMEVYPNSSSDIPKLSEIGAKESKLLKEEI
jgi:hypothetical protein